MQERSKKFLIFKKYQALLIYDETLKREPILRSPFKWKDNRTFLLRYENGQEKLWHSGSLNEIKDVSDE